MSDIERLLRDGVETAYELQAGDRSPSGETKRRVIRRGRRRRAGRLVAGVATVALFAGGATSATVALVNRDADVAGRPVPDLGAEPVRNLTGGALASDGNMLWVGSGTTTNTEGDKNSIARMDLATREVVTGDPAVLLPYAMDVGASGLWTVAWEGDMPVGGEGHPVRGAVERVDPVSLERTGVIAREDSAPHDVDVAETAGVEFAWVVDAGRDELLKIEAETMTIAQTYPTASSPTSVYVHDGSVYVTSTKDHVVQRFDAATGELTAEHQVPDCAHDVVAAAGWLWVTDYCSAAVQRVDPEGVEKPVAIPVRDAPSAIAAGGGLLWVATFDSVVRIDPVAGEVVGRPVYGVAHPGSMVYEADALWVDGSDSVYRVGEDVPPGTPPPTPPPSEAPGDDPLPAGVERFEVDGFAGPLAAVDEGVWAGRFSVDRLDVESGEVLAEIESGGFVTGLELDAATGLLWAQVEIAEKETNALVAINTDSDEVELGPVLVEPPGVYEDYFDAGGGVAWAPGDDAILTGVAYPSGRSTQVDLGEYFRGPDDPASLRAVVTNESVFVMSTSGVVARMDLSSGKHERVADLGPNVEDATSDGELVWVLQTTPPGKIRLRTLDGDTGDEVGSPIEVGEFGTARVAEYDGTVWVLHWLGEDTATLYAFQDGAGEPARAIEVPVRDYVTDLSVGPTGAWFAAGEALYKVSVD